MLSLVAAVRSGDLAEVRRLVKKAGSWDFRSVGGDLLRSASFQGHLRVVQYLVYRGADIRDAVNHCVRVASLRGHLALVRYLVSIGADIRASKNQCVRWASRSGHFAAAQYLVSAGADIRADANWYARLSRRVEVASLLVAFGAPRGLIPRAIDALAPTAGGIRAVYFWWVPRCYDRGRRAGRRMARRSLFGFLRTLEARVPR